MKSDNKVFRGTVRETRVIAAFLGFICAVLIVLVLRELRTIFIPMIFAVLLSIMLRPAIKLLRRIRIPQGLGLAIMMLVVFFVFYLAGLIVYSSSTRFVREFPKYEASMDKTIATTLETLNINIEGIQEYLQNIDWNKTLGKYSLSSTVSSTLGSFLTFLGNVLLIIIFTIFILSGQLKMGDKLKRAFPQPRAAEIIGIIKTIEQRVQIYLINKLLISLATAIVGMGFIILFKVDFPIFSAVIIFALNFIPNIGSVIATIFPILICFLEYGYTLRVPGLAVCLIAAQMVFGNAIEPLVLGKGLNLSPLVVILSLIFWGWVWGIIGMVLAVPLTSTLVIIFEHIDPLRPIAVLVGGEGFDKK